MPPGKNQTTRGSSTLSVWPAFISAEVEMVPSTTSAITDEDNQKLMAKLLDALEDDDDVQNVWHNLENEEDLDR